MNNQTSLSKLPQQKTHPITNIEKYHMIKEYHSQHTNIYTDGCKNRKRVGKAMVRNKSLKKMPPK